MSDKMLFFWTLLVVIAGIAALLCILAAVREAPDWMRWLIAAWLLWDIAKGISKHVEKGVR